MVSVNNYGLPWFLTPFKGFKTTDKVASTLFKNGKDGVTFKKHIRSF